MENRIERNCINHGLTSFRLTTDNRYRCVKCASNSVSKRKREKKLKLVAAFGGACIICGYSKYHGAMQFHHRDPSTKEFCVNANTNLSYDKLYAEALKCDLVCANCHAEVHEL